MEHRVAIRHTMRYTWAMRSIRISDELFDLARDESGAMSRSIAQQLEHWAKIGAALEQADVTQEQVRRILRGDLRVARARLHEARLAQAGGYVLDSARESPQRRAEGTQHRIAGSRVSEDRRRPGRHLTGSA